MVMQRVYYGNNGYRYYSTTSASTSASYGASYGSTDYIGIFVDLTIINYTLRRTEHYKIVEQD